MFESGLQRFMQLYAKGEVVFRESEPGKEMFVVCSGKIDLYKEQQDKKFLLPPYPLGIFRGDGPR